MRQNLYDSDLAFLELTLALARSVNESELEGWKYKGPVQVSVGGSKVKKWGIKTFDDAITLYRLTRTYGTTAFDLLVLLLYAFMDVVGVVSALAGSCILLLLYAGLSASS